MEEMDEGIELIECGHDCFHPQCIMQWFRSGFKRCPICNDTGLSESVPKRTGEESIKLIKAQFRKGKTNETTTKLVAKLYKTEAKLVDVKKQITSLKSEHGIFRDLLLKERKLWSKRRSINNVIIDLKRSIVQICVMSELILVTKKKIYRNIT